MPQTNFNSLVEKMLELDKATKKTIESMDKLDKQFEELSKKPSLKKNAEVLKKINTVSVKLIKTEKELIKTRGQISKLNQKAIREADKITQSISLEAQVRRHNELLLKKEISEKGKLIALEQRYGKVHKNSVLALQRRTNALVKYNKTLDINSKKYKQNAQAILKNTNRLKRFDKAIGRSQRNVGNYGQSFRSLLGAAGLGTGIYGMIRALGNAIKIFRNFEKASKRLQAILGVNAKEIKSLTEQAKNLGSITAFTASEILGLQTELAKLGFTLPQIEASTEGILALAAATGTELASAAELAGATIRIFGLDASEAGRVADVLALSTSKSALTMEKLATALPTVGTTAKQAGLSLEQTTALLGTLSNRGLDASTSATALRNIFLQLSKKGITFNEAMEKINNSVNKSKTAMELFNIRSATAGVILSETEEITRELELALNDASGAAQDMADVMLDNLAGDITIAKSAWEGFVLSIEDGEGVISTSIRGIVKGITSILTVLKDLNDFGDIISDKARENAEERVEAFKEFIKDVDEEEKRRRLSIRFYEIERDLIKEQKLLNDERWEQNPEWVQSQIDIVNALEREKELLKGLNLEGNTEAVIENTDATDGNTDAVNKNKKALKERNEVIKETIKLYEIQLEEGVIGTERAAADMINKAEKITTGAGGKEGKGGLLGRIFGFGKENIDQIFNSLSLFADAFGTWINNQLEKYDELISKQEENISGIQEELKTELERIDEAKKAGQAYDLSRKQALQDQLKAEQAYLNASLAEQKKAKQKQQNMEAATAAINVAAGIINIWKSGNWITNLLESAALAALGLVQISTIKSARFAKGTESVSGYGSPDGVDTVPAMLTKKERIMTVDQNKAMPKGFKNDWIPMAAHYWLNKDKSNTYINNNGDVVDRLDKVVENTSQNTIYGIDGMLKKETKGSHTIYYN